MEARRSLCAEPLGIAQPAARGLEERTSSMAVGWSQVDGSASVTEQLARLVPRKPHFGRFRAGVGQFSVLHHSC